MAVVLVAACGACAAPPPQGYGVQAAEQQAARFEQQQEQAESGVDQPGLYAGLIREMQGKGLYFASLAHLDAYVQRFGRSDEVELMRADAYRHTQQFEASAKIYRSLLTSQVAAFAWQGLGLIAAAGNHYAQASTHFAEAVRRNPTDAAMVADYGFSLLKQGRVDEARVPVVQAAELAPGSTKIVGNLAIYLYLKSNAAAAEAVMDKAAFSDESRRAIRQLAQQIARAQTSVEPAPALALVRPAARPVAPGGPAVSLPPPSLLDRLSP
ncbi:MAG: pilus assembly protein [Pigmentiphaga sp.]|nr:pilus assembly protein [Pigmentiphaga sp.]